MPNRTQRGKDFTRAAYAYTKGLILAQRKDVEAAKAQLQAHQQLADALGGTFIEQRTHELAGAIALAEKAYDTALAQLQQANAVEVYNMYRLGLAYEGLGNRQKAREMYHYVVTYHSPLNLNYSFVRHRAADRLERLGA